MASQLNINNFIVELSENITYNFTTSNVGDLSVSKSNYTSSFKIPRTLENQRFFDGLGIPGDRSRYPYISTQVDCMDNYVVIYSGNLVILKSDRLYYHATVISGAFNFFSVIGDKMFSDLDLSEVLHPKTLNVVQANLLIPDASQPLPLFAYFIGAFAVNQHYDAGLNIDAMAPAISVKYLLDKAFESAQMSYTLPASVNIDEEYLTFPYPPYAEVSEGTGGGTSTLEKNQVTFQVAGSFSLINYRSQYASWTTTSFPTSDFQQDGFDLIVQRSGNYLFDFVECYGRIQWQGNATNVQCVISVNGSERSRFWTNFEPFPIGSIAKIALNVKAGDRIRFDFDRIITNEAPPPSNISTIFIGPLDVVITGTQFTDTGIEQIFGLSIRDFVKEIMFRYALIPFANGNDIDFITLGDMLDRTQAIDWTDKYDERTEESYDIGYSINNWLQHSYVDENSGQPYDRNIISDNNNLNVSKPIVESKFTAPPLREALINPNLNVTQISVPSPLFTTYEVTESDGSVTVNTDKRYYFVELNRFIASLSVRLTSPSQGGSLQSISQGFYTGKFTAGFNTNPYWNPLQSLVNNSRMHIIEIDMKQMDVYQLNQRVPYFFRQEGAYYILNSIQYQKGKISKGSFIKINY